MVLLVHERKAEKEGDVRILFPRSVGALIQGRKKENAGMHGKGPGCFLATEAVY